MQNANQTNNARLELIRASEIEPKEIDWLWVSLHSLRQGHAAAGRPRRWEKHLHADHRRPAHKRRASAIHGQAPRAHHVIYQTTEDDADDTIVHHFIKANGDRERLVFINEMHRNYKAHGWNRDMDARLAKVCALRTDHGSDDE